MAERTTNVLNGQIFVVGDRLGDVCPGEGVEHGFFCADTRFISQWALKAGETPLELLSTNQSNHYQAQFFLMPRSTPATPSACSLIRRRLIDNVWMEEITLTNHLHERARFCLGLEVSTDFADLFEVKDGSVRSREIACTYDDYELTFEYVGRTALRARSRSYRAWTRLSMSAGSLTS